MPKLRNGTTDIGKFANWLGRKIVNHNPLAELKMTDKERAHTANIYKAKGVGKVHQVAGDESTVVCHLHDGRSFVVSVREADAEETAALVDRATVLLR